MPRPRTITDDQIKQAARAVFVEHGPTAPVSLVAKALGVSHAALFNRTGSKDNLMREALSPERPPGLGRLAAPAPSRDLLDYLGEILLDLMVFFQRVVPNLIVLKTAGLTADDLGSSDGPAPPELLRGSLASWLGAAMERGLVDEMQPAGVAEGLLGAIEARCFNAYLGGREFAPGDDASFVRTLVESLVRVPAPTRA